eukprot:gene9870-2192_t
MEKNYLSNLGISVKQDWLELCIDFVKREIKPKNQNDMNKQILEQFLDSDLNYIGDKNLNEQVQTLHNKTIKGPHVIQINKVRDISRPMCEELEETENKYSATNKFRTLMIEFTDGNQTFKGMEYRHINSMNTNTPKGTKIVVKDVLVRRGILLLIPQCIKILGDLSTKEISNLTPILPFDFFEEDSFSNELKTDGSNEREARSLYKQIIKLLKNDKTSNVTDSIRFVRESFEKNKFLPTQDAVDIALNYAREYIKRLETNFESKKDLSEISDKQKRLIKYWDTYYSSEHVLDSWYCEFDTIEKYLPYLSPNTNALILGSGISGDGVNLLKKIKCVTEVDFSNKVFEIMNELYKDLPNMKLLKEDILTLNLPNESFDLIFDKGTFDHIISEDEKGIDYQLIEENVWNLLNSNGIFMICSVIKLNGIKEMFSYYNWNIQIVEISYQTTNVNCVKYINYPYLVIGKSNGEIIILNNNKEISSIKLKYSISQYVEKKKLIKRISFNENENEILVSGLNSTLNLIRISSQRFVLDTKFEGHDSFLTDSKFSFDGKFMLSTSIDKSFKLWNKNIRRPLFSHSLKEIPNACCFDPKDSFTLLTSFDNYVEIYDIRKHNSYLRLIEGNLNPNGINSSDSISKFSFFDNESTSQRIEDDEFKSISNLMKTKSFKRQFTDHRISSKIFDIQFSSCGSYLITSSTDNTIKMWDMKTGKGLFTFNGCNLNSRCRPKFFYDDRIILCGSNDGYVYFWKTFEGKDESNSGNHFMKLKIEKYPLLALDIGGKDNFITTGDTSSNLYTILSGSFNG